MVVGQSLPGQRSTGDVLSEGLAGVAIPAIEADPVVDGEPGMSTAQEGVGELLRDEAQLQEQPDGAPAKALAEANGIVDGDVVELPGGIETALEDESVKMWVEPKRVAEGLIGHDGGSADGPASSGGVELRDQVEDQPCKVGEQECSFLAARRAEEEGPARPCPIRPRGTRPSPARTRRCTSR